MKTVETTVFEFSELSDEAKEKAREWYRSGAFDHEWWDTTFEDAERIGLKITSFDLDRVCRQFWPEPEAVPVQVANIIEPSELKD